MRGMKVLNPISEMNDISFVYALHAGLFVIFI